MLDKNLEARTELTSMSYAAEVFLRMLNLYRGSYYKLRNAGPILRLLTTCRKAATSQHGR